MVQYMEGSWVIISKTNYCISFSEHRFVLANSSPLYSISSVSSLFTKVPVYGSLAYKMLKGHPNNIHIYMTVCQKVSEYDQEIPQSHTADQPTAP